MIEIRPYQPADLDDLYRICLATTANGFRYRDPKLVGQVYAAPYAVMSPRTVFVVEDANGVGGYIVGAPDTRDFEARLETEWWPALRKIYPNPSGIRRTDRTADEFMSWWIHHPQPAPDEIIGPYPSHLHINLLPRLRGRGVGRRLMERWLRAVGNMGSRGAHLAVGAANTRAIRFYRACGFRELERRPSSSLAPIWFGIRLDPRFRGNNECATDTRRFDLRRLPGTP